MSAKQDIQKLLKKADIRTDGLRDSDITVYDNRVYERVLSDGSLGLGESYMDGWWTCKRIDKMIHKVLKANLVKEFSINPRTIMLYLKSKLNPQRLRAYNIGQKHYDIGNNLYSLMLDKNMQYSCAYWKDAKTLDKAQEAKMDLICRKLELKKGESLLDIGCGWGGLLRYAAENYGIRGVGLTVSKEQAKYAQEKSKGLPIEFKIIDYRKYAKKFDKIVSVGMVEHVGPKNYKEFMKTVNRNLKPPGLFLLHTIGSNKSNNSGDPWIDKYIFPDGVLPSVKQIAKAAEGLFTMEDFHNFGKYYENTLIEWNKNFQKAWPKLKPQYSERFKRMWEYYLLCCAATFRARHCHLWQIVFSKNREQIYETKR